MKPWEVDWGTPDNPRPVNNPGNMRRPGEPVGFQQFPDQQAGLDAIDRQLLLYGSRGINTLEGIISKWSPPNENQTARLIEQNASFLGVDPRAPLDLNNPEVRARVREAIVRQEGNAPKTAQKAVSGPGKPWEHDWSGAGKKTQPAPAKGATGAFGGGATGDFDQKATGPSGLESFGMGAADPIHGGAQLLTKVLPQGVVDAGNQFNNWLADKTGMVARVPEGGVDQMVRDREAEYQARRAAAGETGVDWARMGGNVASPANIAMSARLPAMAARGLGARMGVGAAGGAAGGGMMPVTEGDFWDEKNKQLGVGGAFGAATPALTSAFSRLVSPRASTNPQVQMLQQRGVRPTIGQTLGGWANTTEEKAQSLPIMGDAIRAARARSRDDFNRAVINEPGRFVGGQIDDIGQGGVARLSRAVDDAYDAARSAVRSFRFDPQGTRELASVQSMAQNLPLKEQRAFRQTWDAILTDISPRGHITGDVFKRIDSKLGNDAAKFSGSNDAYQQLLGDAFRELQRVVRETARRSNPEAAELFSRADSAFARLVSVQNASNKALLNEGVFTPGQLLSGIKQADRSVRDNVSSRGAALMQDLGNAGQRVLGNKYPDSGTAGRVGLGGLALGAGYFDPSIPIGLGLGALGYQRPFQSLLTGLASRRPPQAQTISDALRQFTPALIPGAGQAGVNLLNY